MAKQYLYLYGLHHFPAKRDFECKCGSRIAAGKLLCRTHGGYLMCWACGKRLRAKREAQGYEPAREMIEVITTKRPKRT